jgi:hypothetical protein
MADDIIYDWLRLKTRAEHSSSSILSIGVRITGDIVFGLGYDMDDNYSGG